MNRQFSAYLSVFNDWDILTPALRSIAPQVQELVVVDGGYRWMAPYLDRIGVPSDRSDKRVLEAVAEAGIPFKLITGVWENELEKRMAGYRACTNRYIYRVDADEILYFDQGALEAFLASGQAVANMLMPEYIAPGWIRAPKGGGGIEQQSLLFDREKVSPEAHLHCLWLVRGPEELPTLAEPMPSRFPRAIAFNAHLTDWRTPQTAVTRASFYTLNYYRTNRVPWLPEFAHKPVTDFGTFFDIVDAAAYRESRLTSCHVVNVYSFDETITLRQTPLPPQLEVKFAALYDQYLASLAELNAVTARDGRTCVRDEAIRLDLSSEAATAAIVCAGRVTVEFENPLLSAVARLRFLTATAPFQTVLKLPFVVTGSRITIQLDTLDPAPISFIRRVLEFQVWTESRKPFHQFQIIQPSKDV